MKRSEMIKKLEQLGKQYCHDIWIHVTPEVILDMVEKLGMEPPPQDFFDCYDCGNGWTTYEWEPEDE